MQTTREQPPSEIEHTAAEEDPSQQLEMATGAVLPSGIKREWGSGMKQELPLGHPGGYAASNFSPQTIPILLSPTKPILPSVETPEQGPTRKIRKVGPPLGLSSPEYTSPVAPSMWPVQPAAPKMQPDFTHTIGPDSSSSTGAQHPGQPTHKQQESEIHHPPIAYHPHASLSMGSTAYGNNTTKSEAVDDPGLLVPLPPMSKPLAQDGEGTQSSTATLEVKVGTQSNQATQAPLSEPTELMPLAPSSCSSSPCDPASSSGYICSRVEELFPKLLFLPGHPLQVNK